MDIAITNRGLPKWPQMKVTGMPVGPERAKEIIRRTDTFFMWGSGGNDRQWNRSVANMLRMPLEDDIEPGDMNAFNTYNERMDKWRKAWGVIDTFYVHNEWMSSAFIYGPSGWVRPDGTINYSYNVGRWPEIQEIVDDWTRLACEFQFLDVGVTLMSGEHGEDDIQPVASIRILDDRVVVVDPFKHDVHEDHPPYIHSVREDIFEKKADYRWIDGAKGYAQFEHGVPEEWINEWAQLALKLNL